MNLIPRDELARLVRQLARAQAFWVDEPSTQPGQQSRSSPAWIELSPLSIGTKGEDEYRQRPRKDNPNALLSTITGWRRVTISLRAKSQSTFMIPYELLERVRAGFSTVTASTVYHQVNIAFVRAGPVLLVRGGERQILDATMDAVFGMQAKLVPTDDDGQTIDTINGVEGIPIDLK
jgi:hypothetical protein